MRPHQAGRFRDHWRRCCAKYAAVLAGTALMLAPGACEKSEAPDAAATASPAAGSSTAAPAGSTTSPAPTAAATPKAPTASPAARSTPATTPRATSAPVRTPAPAGDAAYPNQKDAEAHSAAANLPAPPDLATYTPELAEVIARAIRRAAEERTAEAYGSLGKIYHALLSSREETDRPLACYKEAERLDPQSALWPYLLGRIYLVRRSFEPARAEFLKGQALEPQHPRWELWLGILEQDRSAFDVAKAHYRQYIELAPEHPEGHAALAATELELGNDAAAKAAAERAIELEPNQGTAWQVLADYHAKREERVPAMQAAARGRSLPPAPGSMTRDAFAMEIWLPFAGTTFGAQQVAKLLSAGDFANGKAMAEAFIERKPDDVRMLANLAEAFVNSGHLEDAEKHAGKARELDPKYAPAVAILAQCAHLNRTHEEALALIDEALALDPTMGMGQTLRGRCLYALNRHEEAMAAFQKAAELMPQHFVPLVGQAEVHLARRQYAEAKAALREAVARAGDPERMPQSMTTNLIALAQLEMRDNELAEAARHLEMAVRLNPTAEGIFRQLAEVLIQLDRGQDALLYCRNLYEQNPQILGFARIYGEILARLNKPDDALKHLEQIARQAPPEDISIPLTRAHILYDVGRFEEARAVLGDVLAREPRAEDAYSLLAMIAVRQKDYAQGVQAVRRGMEQVPESFMLKNTLAWILATCPEESVRRPEEAVALAEEACAATNQSIATLLDTLACAYAAAGRFEEARQTEQRAVDLAQNEPGQGDPGDFAARLELFSEGQAFIDKSGG